MRSACVAGRMMAAAFIARAGGDSMRSQRLKSVPSMPLAGPSYPAASLPLINREFLVITMRRYCDDPGRLPEQLEPTIRRS